VGFMDRFKKKTDEADDGEVTTETAETVEAAPVHDDPPPEPVAAAEPAEPAAPGDYRAVHIRPGKRGWGVGFDVKPEPGKDLIYSVTGGGIHPVAQRIADLSGGKPFDGFKSKAGFDEIAVAVIDCGGTARIGVYPMKGVLTVDIHGASPSGPLIRFITEENFVSGVTPDDVEVIDG
jgi:glucitol/sorbitol PTS system EIIB component